MCSRAKPDFEKPKGLTYIPNRGGLSHSRLPFINSPPISRVSKGYPHDAFVHYLPLDVACNGCPPPGMSRYLHWKYNDAPKVSVTCDQFIALNDDDNSDYLCMNLSIQCRYHPLDHEGCARKQVPRSSVLPLDATHEQARFAATRMTLLCSTVP